MQSISLWKELYERFTKVGKEIRPTDFWADLREICLITPEEAKNTSETVRKAYFEDIRLIKVPKQGEPATTPNNPTGNNNIGTGAGTDEAMLAPLPSEMSTFLFEKSRIILPKEDTQATWIKIKKMMDIYLDVKKEGAN